jgi:Carboxypeptidase regulatory-like domain/TonB dependent receptor-like, beta-barrel
VTIQHILIHLAVAYYLAFSVFAQATSGEILGEVRDPSGAVVSLADVTIRNLDTNTVRSVPSTSEGRFRFPALPVGSYEITVEKVGFARYVRGPILLRLNQHAELLDINLQLAGISEGLIVSADAPLINTTNAELGVNFDSTRVAELPLAPNRNVMNLALSVAGVSQLSSGNTEVASGINFSVNGSRLRSNNFLIDGQDVNNVNVTGPAQEINNPDAVAELRLSTNQFAPEYGHAMGSVANIITKTGTNQFHGSAYWFYNGNKLNARTNLDSGIFEAAPWRIENQFAGTLGGPLVKDRIFFFGSFLRWTDHKITSGSRITGVPTKEGQDILRSVAGDRPQVRALLEHVPPAQVTDAPAARLVIGGRPVEIPLGSLSGFAREQLDVSQSVGRLDHHLRGANLVGGRYLFDDRYNKGGQAVPPGLTDQTPQRRQAASAFLNTFSRLGFNELRLSYQRSASRRTAVDPKSEEIPNIQIQELGLVGANPSPTRTAIGLPTLLPSFSFVNNYHLSDVFGMQGHTHSAKFGIDFRREEHFYAIGSNNRGRLTYTTFQNFVDDIAQDSQINASGRSPSYQFRYYDYAFFVQDEWRARNNLSLTYGIRYESPGSPVPNLVRLDTRILAENNNDPAFNFEPVPKRDTNNWSPRIGFNYRFKERSGPIRVFTGRGQLVLRGGYSRSYDSSFNQIFQNVAAGFPFAMNYRLAANSRNAFTTFQAVRSGQLVPVPVITNQVRSTVAADFRAPAAEQFSLQFQRELASNWVWALGWIGTKGTGLFQTVDGNPTLPTNNSNGALRVDPTRGVVRLRCNCASSIYHSLQSSIEKRLSAGFSMAAHYTWSTFIDDVSDIFNASSSGDIAVAQDSFNRHADRGRSTYDRPHRFALNGIIEVPFMRNREGMLGHLFGGWDVSGFLTLQSGPPFSPLNGSDPGSRLSGISLQVGNAIRPNLNTALDLSRMSLEEIIAAGGRKLFSEVTASNPLGNAGRNILRADGINNVDLGISKSTRIGEAGRLQVRSEFYNLFNSRDFGIPEAIISNPGFGLQWNTDGGGRRIVVGLRYTF